MVKYVRKVTSSMCLSRSFTAVHKDIPKCMPEERLHPEPVKLSFRGFESRRAPKAYRQRFGLSFGTQKGGIRKFAFVCENVFIQRSVIIRQREKSSAFLSEQCKSEPCLRMDTVLSESVPKEFFPHRAGGT